MSPAAKICNVCGQTKAAEDFARDPDRGDGLRRCCRVCDAARVREREARHRREQETADRGHVVVFGCRKAGLQRIHVDTAPSAPHGRRAPLVDVQCACGEVHRVEAMSRPRRPGEVCDLHVDELRPRRSPQAPPGGSRPRITSKAILEALTAADRPAQDVAAEVGFDNTGSLLRRLERDAKDEFGRVVVTKGGGFNNPTRLRLKAGA